MRYIKSLNYISIKLRKSKMVRIIERKLRFNGMVLLSIGDTNTNFWHPGWQTVDLIDADYICDCRKKRIPIDDNSVDIINYSHVVEHIGKVEIQWFFSEVYRVLKSGGFVRFATPDADKLIAKYKKNDWRYFLCGDGDYILHQIKAGKIPPETLLIHNRLIGWFASYSGRLDTAGGPLEAKQLVDEKLNTLTTEQFADWCVSLLKTNRIYAHVNVYSYDRLANELKQQGFHNIKHMNYNISKSDIISKFHIDREHVREYSLYCEAFK